MDRPPSPSESHRIESLTYERNALVALIEALHAAILTKADASVIRGELDELARLAERKFGQGRAPSGSGRKSFPRARSREHEAFLSQLIVFRQTFAGEPNAFDHGQLYDFLSEWLIDALCDD